MSAELAAEWLTEIEAEMPDALRLARLTSLAVRVERHLLRRLRLDLLPSADVGTEADLWFSPLVHSRGSGSFVLDPDAALLLRNDLARDRQTFPRAVVIIEAEHRHAPAVIRLEERIHAIAATGGDDVVAQIDEALRPALRTLRQGGARGEDIARWAMRAAPLFDRVFLESANAQALLIGSSALLGGRRIIRESPNSSASFVQVAWIVPALALSERVRLGVEMTAAGVRFVNAESGAPTLDLPRTTPALLEVSWVHKGEHSVVLVDAEPGRSLQTDPGVDSLKLRALDGSEYNLRKHSAPPSTPGSAQTPSRPLCFVIMGFGKKVDFETGKTFDLDMSYQHLIKPAVEAAGVECIRADEITHAGVIDVPMYERIFAADLVVADISTGNRNAIYELGVRHALRPHSTIILAEDSNRNLGFDLNHIVIRKYRHLGEDIGATEARERGRELTNTIREILSAQEPKVDSPVYHFIPGLRPPSLVSSMEAAEPMQDKSSIADKDGIFPLGSESHREVAGERKPFCFVVMGFGKKVDFETGKTFDLDMSYQHLIKPAVEAAGVECIRADEITHAGVIDVPMYERIFAADLVVADISTGNRNAIYELGVRHALRPHSTIILAEDSNRNLGFDLNHIVIRKYRHLGEDIGATEARERGRELTNTIREILSAQEPKVDSPVYHFIPGLRPPSLARRPAAVSAATAESPQSSESHAAVMALVREAQDKGDFATARSLLNSIVTVMKTQVPDRPVDPSILQQFALATYKSKQPTDLDALREASAILAELEPETTNDTETLGLWAAVHKRLWQVTHDRSSLDSALRALERGFNLRKDYYNGINLAYLLNERALEQTDARAATEDFNRARRVRREVRDIAEAWLKESSEPGKEQPPDKIYWVHATLAEAFLGLGDEAASAQWLQKANALTPAPAAWMRESAATQFDNLRKLLAAAAAKGIPLQGPSPAAASHS